LNVKKMPLAIFFLKMTIFVNFFEKKKSSFWQFFDIKMAIFQRVSLPPE